MTDQKKLDRWADKLLDTGKRNNLINYRDTRASSAEIVFPDVETVFANCMEGRHFEVFDPSISDDELDSYSGDSAETKRLSRTAYIDLYSPQIKNNRYILIYGQTPNPMTAVRNIAKKAQERLDETGINVAYLAFGFLEWNEKKGSEVFYRAPLLLVHVNIVTGSIVDPITIDVSDDDVVVNPTFSYLLQAEYGMTLPDFQDGDTLDSYCAKLDPIVQKLGWDILKECKLGLFSFLKINMYEDLKTNAEQILDNGNVRLLLGEQIPALSNAIGIEDEPVVSNPLIDLHTVVDADSSQIEAIEMAKSGKSFVLQGPPGTGKSQTITNIIAECLYDGKKVLFVSEKQAALNVVFDKLKKAGLADFCLELHSHKANKKAVISELNRTLETPRYAVSSGAQEEIRQKLEAQIKLDRYAIALHKTQETIDKSLYELFELYSAVRGFPTLEVSFRNIQIKGQDYYTKAIQLLEQYVEYIPSVGYNYQENAWFGFTNLQIGFDDRGILKSDLQVLLEGYRRLNATVLSIRQRIDVPELNYRDALVWKKILSFLSGCCFISPSILSTEKHKKILSVLPRMMELSQSIISVKESILAQYRPEVLSEFDGKEIHSRLIHQYNTVYSRLFNPQYKELLAEISQYNTSNNHLKYRHIVEFSSDLMSLQEMTSEYQQYESMVSVYFGNGYKGIESDWERAISEFDYLGRIINSGITNFGMLESFSTEEFVSIQSDLKSFSDILKDETADIYDAIVRVSKQFTTDSLNLEIGSFDHCIEKIDACLMNFDKLGNWIGFVGLLQQIDASDLRDFVDAVVKKSVESNQIIGTYRRAFYKHWIEYILFSTPELSSFSRITQDQAVQIFVRKDNLQYEINKSKIQSKLSQERPNLDIVAGGSAVAILRREGQKKRKQMPIRKLLAEIGGLVQIIKPCFLMSPLSVSTFLDTDKITFDTVVFDEASQIFPQDAIGAIYRGKQLIVVGDSRQMPPSNFFNSSADVDDDDEEIGDITDFESILDICSSVLTTERLAWHYRSHYEQLIAFSNYHFYNNNLVTFPSSSTDHEGIGVDYYYVDGVFDRKSKTNKAEAEFIVDLIYRNIKENPNRSLGVVAFSVAQQNLIDKLLCRKREANPSFEWFFKSDRAEPFFIKNLETVQGDERDTIIFSIAYAKDAQGRFIHNFGPLNREGGERRLNVAVTRAKENVQLVASIHYSDINLNNTESEGVRLLRAYLDYAQNGEQALDRSVELSRKDQFDSYFEQEVCDFLRDHGFAVDTQVGVSGYRIDLALRKPNSSNYLLAIECDGATYHNSKNARDRDSLRQRILERMGWRFYRIWSTDWYRNTAVEKERLLQTAKTIVSAADEPKTIETDISNQDMEGGTAEEQGQFFLQINESQFAFPEYKQADAAELMQKHHFQLKPAVREILEIEAPLSEEYLLKRIVMFFDREKVTKVVTDMFNRQMYGYNNLGIVRRDGFLYLKDMDEIKLRVPGVRREIKYIAIEELADGFYTLIKQNVTVSKEGLYSAMTKLLGFNRTGDAIVSRYNRVLHLLLRSDKVTEQDGLLSVVD